ncbi:hypothetical protein LTR94_034728, partial [Friedmanniomyces endolithicus]
MAKKPTDAANGDNEQVNAAAGADASTPAGNVAASGAETAASPADVAAAPLPDIPEPIFAQDKEGQHRPMSGGSFIRLEDGTLIRNPEA